MSLYVGKTFTATVTGRRVIDVRCDKCQTSFQYELVREATGSGTAPYYIGVGAAERRAQAAAERNLEKYLSSESELVPCPHCHWLNAEVVRGYRRTRYKPVMKVAFVLASVAWVVVLFALNAMPARRSDRYPIEIAALIGLAAGGVVLLAGLLVRRWLRSLINPNRHYPIPPTLPPGTPRAWTEKDMASPIDPSPGLARRDVPDPYPGWAVFRLGHLMLPPGCCECLQPATTEYRTLFRASENDHDFPSPLCGACNRRLRMLWLVGLLLTFAIAGLVAAGLYFGLDADQFGRAFAAIVGGGFLAMLGAAAVPNAIAKPYSMRVVDRARSVYRVRFRNRQYTDLVRIASALHEETTFRRPAP